MANEGQPSHLLNSLCTALAICTMHMRNSWENVLEVFLHEFSDSVDHAICLLITLRYMASDCDNDSIVIEDSLRQEYFQYLDEIAPSVFEKVFNTWAKNLLKNNLGQIVRSLSQTGKFLLIINILYRKRTESRATEDAETAFKVG
jgi:Exportin 1-like protein